MEKIDWGKMSEKLYLWVWLIMVAGIVTGSGLWIIFGPSVPPQVPLLYSRPWGEDQLVKKGWLILPWLLGLVGAGMTSLWMWKLKQDKVLLSMVMGGMLVFEIIVMIAVVRIILLIT